MIIVADTTPLISLMKIGQLDLLEKLFGEVQIPEAVFEELIYNSNYPEESKLIRESQFIIKVFVNNTSAVELLHRSSGLDAGESEAIILSDSLNASLLLMDEVKGRQVEKQMGIPLMGTLGLLLVGYKENILTKQQIIEYIDIMKKSGRHISEALYQQLLAKISEIS